MEHTICTHLFRPSKFNIPISPKKSPAFIVVNTLPVSLSTSSIPSAMINISRATSPFRHIESPGVKMYAFIFNTKSCRNSGWHSWNMVTCGERKIYWKSMLPLLLLYNAVSLIWIDRIWMENSVSKYGQWPRMGKGMLYMKIDDPNIFWAGQPDT